jgi:hypothetical protein
MHALEVGIAGFFCICKPRRTGKLSRVREKDFHRFSFAIHRSPIDASAELGEPCSYFGNER